MKLQCEFVEKKSKKGESYYCLEVVITPTYTKQIFLDQADVELLRAMKSAKDQMTNNVSK